MYTKVVILDTNCQSITGMPVLKGEKYAFNLWFRECSRSMLYEMFNPEYYRNLKQADNLVITENIKGNYLKKKINESEFKNKSYDIKVNRLPETLQVGDYIPFIKIKGQTIIKELHNYCNEKPFAFITVTNISDLNRLYIKLEIILKNCNVIILFKLGDPKFKTSQILYTKDIQLSKILLIETEQDLHYQPK